MRSEAARHESKSRVFDIELWSIDDYACWYEYIFNPVSEADGSLVTVVGATRDITFRGKVLLQLQRVPLAPTITAALDAVRVDALRKGVTLHGPAGEVPSRIDCDPDRLRQVFWNQLANAVKFTPAGGGVRVGVRADESSVEVSVTDTGIGFAADFLPRLFDRFSQADSSSTRREGGLGLSINRSLVEMDGATSAGPGAAAPCPSMELDEALPSTNEESEPASSPTSPSRPSRPAP